MRALDGTYQHESAHYQRCTPRQGGEDNPKGHALLAFQDLRIGVIDDVLTDTRSRHEMQLLRDDDQRSDALTHERRTVWVADRAFVNAPFWDAKKRAQKVTVITRMKKNLRVDSTEGVPIAEHPCNEGVLSDLRIRLTSSREEWRLVRYRTPKWHGDWSY